MIAPSDYHVLGDLIVALYRAFIPTYGRIVSNVAAVYVIQLCHEQMPVDDYAGTKISS